MKSMGLKEQKKFGILFLAVGAALFIVGLALGAGLYTLALVLFFALLCSMSGLPALETHLKDRSNHFEVHLELKNKSAIRKRRRTMKRRSRTSARSTSPTRRAAWHFLPASTRSSPRDCWRYWCSTSRWSGACCVW